MRIRPFLLVALLVGAASAQQTAVPLRPSSTTQAATLDLPQALARAYAQGAALANAQTNLANAELQLEAVQADPSALVLQKTQAQQAATQSRVALEATRLQVLQSVVSSYQALYEAQQDVTVAQAQRDLADRDLQVAQAKFGDGNATSLDVAKARTALQSARQTLANAEAKVPAAGSQLATLLGVTDLGSVTVVAPPDLPQVSAKPTDLEQGLLQRLPSVVQARQSVELYTLQVKLYDNDYTPRMTYQTAKTSLDNAQRGLDTARQNAATSLANAYQAARDAYARIAIGQQNLDNVRQVLQQDRAALEAGTVSALQVQSDEVAVASSTYSLLQAVDGYRNALVTLSVSAGQDLTGLVGPATPGTGGAS